jgi:hypothetical protein
MKADFWPMSLTPMNGVSGKSGKEKILKESKKFHDE